MAPAITCDCGRCTKCKRRVYMRGWYARNRETAQATARHSRLHRIEAVREYDRERGRSEERKAAKRERAKVSPASDTERAGKRRWGQENPEKRRAHAMLAYHIRAGNVVRLPCEVCGDPHSEGHHGDYTRPLDVRWLCPTHHGQAHRRYP